MKIGYARKLDYRHLTYDGLAKVAKEGMFEAGHQTKLYEETIIRTVKERNAIDE